MQLFHSDEGSRLDVFAGRRRKEKQDREVCLEHAWDGRLAQTDGGLKDLCPPSALLFRLERDGTLHGEGPSLVIDGMST